MIEKYQIYVIFTVIIAIHTYEPIKYIYKELDGDINNNSGIQFSIFIKDFIGIILYGINKNIKVLIEIENGGKNLILKYGRYSTEESSYNICGCSDCKNIYMKFVVKSYLPQMGIECNGSKHLINITNLQSSDLFEIYPNPKNSKNLTNQTFIWMGNIGPFTGDKGYNILPLKNQLAGCVDKLYFNGKRIILENTNNVFLSSCFSNINETICYGENCTTILTPYEMFDCSLQGIDWKHCEKDIFKRIIKNNTIIKKQNLIEETILIRIEWKYENLSHKINNGYQCLVEILLSNQQLIWIMIDKYDQLNIVHSNKSVLISKIMKNQNNIILMKIKNENFTLKNYDNHIIKTFMTSLTVGVVLINVGHSKMEKIYGNFIGEIDFYYDSKLFNLSGEKESDYRFGNYPKKTFKYLLYQELNWILSESFVILLIIFALIIGLIKCRKQNQHQSNAIMTTKMKVKYDDDDFNVYEYELPPLPDDEEEYDLAN